MQRRTQHRVILTNRRTLTFNNQMTRIMLKILHDLLKIHHDFLTMKEKKTLRDTRKIILLKKWREAVNFSEMTIWSELETVSLKLTATLAAFSTPALI